MVSCNKFCYYYPLCSRLLQCYGTALNFYVSICEVSILGFIVKVRIVRFYRVRAGICEFCGEPIRIGEIEVITSSRKHYHLKCFEKLLH